MASGRTFPELTAGLIKGHFPSIARAITVVENKVEGYEDLLENLPGNSNAVITGITGSPGAGKSTITDGLILRLLEAGKKIAVLCIDPSSPFHMGSLLGDRIRMSNWYNKPEVFIRSLSTRGSLGGLNPMVYEIAEVLKAAGFDHILIETVGVGQTEVEISALADTTVVVLVPEGGDDIQAMKSGLMEIGDLFVVNKADRPGTEIFMKNIRQMLDPVFRKEKNKISVIKTIATTGEGLDQLSELILKHSKHPDTEKKIKLLTARAWNQIMQMNMKKYDIHDLKEKIQENYGESFNLYKFSKDYREKIENN